MITMIVKDDNKGGREFQFFRSQNLNPKAVAVDLLDVINVIEVFVNDVTTEKILERLMPHVYEKGQI